MPTPDAVLGGREAVLGQSILGWFPGVEDATFKIATPALYYRMEEASGSVAIDFVNLRNGTYGGSPGFLTATAPSTGGVQFHTGDYLQSGVSVLNVSAGTFSIWVKFTAYPASDALLFGFFENGTTFDKTLYLTSAGTLTFKAIETTGGATRTATFANLPLNRWNHIVVTFGTGIDMYVNSVKVVNNTACTATKSNYTTVGNVYIGGGNPGSSFIEMIGKYDEFVVYSGNKLNQENVNALYLYGAQYSNQSTALVSEYNVDALSVRAAPVARVTAINVEMARDASGAKARVTQLYTEIIRSSADGNIYTPTPISQTLTFTQTPVGQKIGVRSVNQTLTFTQDADYEVVPAGFIYEADVPQTLSFSQIVVGQKIGVRAVTQTLTLTQSEVHNISKFVNQTLSFTEDVDLEAIFGRSFVQGLTFTQDVDLAIEVGRTVEQTLTFSQSAYIAHIYSKEILQGLTFTETTAGLPTKHGENTLSLSQTVARQMIYTRGFIQTLTFTQSLAITRPGTLISQTLVFNQTADWENTIHPEFPEDEEQNLVFSQTVVVNRVYTRAISQSLVLTQSVGQPNVNFGRSVTQELFFYEVDFPNTYPLGTGPKTIIGSQPVAFATVVTNLVVIKSKYGTIVLPAPEFGDKEVPQDQVILKKTMSNKVISHVKTTKRIQLDWTFILSRRKIDELRTFIESNNSEVLTINDWKGRVYVAYMTVNPADLTTQGRFSPQIENVEINLQFQGVRIHG